MKKLILSLLFILVIFTAYGQTANGSETPVEGLLITNPQTVTTSDFITTTGSDGTQGKILGENISLSVIPPVTHFAPLTPNIKGYFQGVDDALGDIVATTAGITTRLWLTADQTTITAGTFYKTNFANKGVVASAIHSVTNNDNEKKYFTQDIIGDAYVAITTFPKGVYAGNLSISTSPNSARQKFTVEVYKCNNAGTPIASGISGAVTGDLGVTVITILDSGELTLADGSVTNVPVSNTIEFPFTINVGERVRYHISAEKVGTTGANITESLYLGTSYNSYIDVPVPLNTSSVQNLSVVDGDTTTDALNNLNNNNVTETTGVFDNIQALIDSNPNGTTINLKPNTVYVQQNALILKDGNTLNGNGATLKRDTQQTTTTTVAATQLSTSITVSSVPTGWKIGDYLQLYTDNTINTSTLKYEAIIQSIAGNVITFTTALRPAIGTTYTWAIGATVRKVYSQITAERLNDLYTVQTAFTVRNLIVDGNKANNTGNYYWGVDMAVAISGHSKFEKCNFINMPNENVMGHGFSVINCYAKDLNGSFIHQSADYTLGENLLGGEVSGNTTINTNLQFVASGHSEGVITFSFTSGRIKIHDNRFLGGSARILGNIYYSNNTFDGSNKDLFFHDNYCENFTGIVNNFGYSAVGLVANVDNVFVSDNIFSNCGANDWSGYLSVINNFGVIKVTRNALSNGTTLINVPLKMQELDFLNAITTNYVVRGIGQNAIGIGSITDDLANVVSSVPITSKASGGHALTLNGRASDNLASMLFTSSAGVSQSQITADNTGALNFNVSSSLTNKFSISTTGVPKFVNLAGTGSRLVEADASGNLTATAVQPKKYVALISQTGTSAPTATVLENTLGGTVTHARTSGGVFSCGFTNAFVSGKTTATLSVGTNIGGSEILHNRAYFTNVNTITYGSYDSGTPTDSRLNSAVLEIRVYP